MTAFLTGLAELTLACGLVIAVLLILTPVLTRRFTPRWRYWAWLILALRLALPFNLSLPWAISLPVPSGGAPAPSVQDAVEESTLTGSAPVIYVPVPDAADADPGRTEDTPFVHSAQAAEAEEGTAVTDWLRQGVQWPHLLFALWAAGGVLTLAAALGRHAAFLRLCRRWRKEAAPEDRAAVEDRKSALGLRGTVAVYRCAAVSTPMLNGLFRPAVLLPLGLTGEALDMALDHELTHWKRRDLWYKALLLWVRAIHWFNPLVHLMCRRAEADVEQCCDYDLLRGQDGDRRRAYGQLLLSQMTAGGVSTSLTTGFSGSRRETLARFRALLDTSVKKNGRAALAMTAAFALLAGGLVACQRETEPVSYDSAAGLYRDEDHAFEVTIPQTVMDQLEVITEEDGENWTISFVSRAAREILGAEFDPEVHSWLLVKQFEPAGGGTSRTVTYGTTEETAEACRAAGMAQEDLDALSELYAGAQEAYHTFIFLSSDSGGESAPTQQAGDWYNEEEGIYLNYDLDFGLEIPPEIYEHLLVITKIVEEPEEYQQIYFGSATVFVDRRLVEELGRNTDNLIVNREVFLGVVSTPELSAKAGKPPHLSLEEEQGETGTAVYETASYARDIADTVFPLSTVDDGLEAGDSYDPETGRYTGPDGLSARLPGWVVSGMRTSRRDGVLTFATTEGDPLLLWDGESLTLPNLTTEELKGDSLRYMDLQDALLSAAWTAPGDSGIALMAGTNCPNDTYTAELDGVSLSDGEAWLYFVPAGQAGGWFLPFASDAVFTPLNGTGEGEQNGPGWVIASGQLSSAYPVFSITVENNEITAFQCVLSDGNTEQNHLASEDQSDRVHPMTGETGE